MRHSKNEGLGYYEKAVLWFVRDDYFGLWEVKSDFRRLLPSSNDDQLRELAASTVRSLLQQGLIRAYLSPWHPRDEFREQSLEDANQLLSSNSSWDVDETSDPDEDRVWIAMTDGGAAAYLEDPWEDSWRMVN